MQKGFTPKLPDTEYSVTVLVSHSHHYFDWCILLGSNGLQPALRAWNPYQLDQQSETNPVNFIAFFKYCTSDFDQSVFIYTRVIIHDHLIGSYLLTLVALHIRLPSFFTRLASELCSEGGFNMRTRSNMCECTSFWHAHSKATTVRLLDMHIRLKQSCRTLFGNWHTQSNKAAVRFLDILGL